ncbi:hypothetical protein ACLOJK_036707, partial [Asimina triloba]
ETAACARDVVFGDGVLVIDMHLPRTCCCRCFASARDLLMDGWGFVLMDANLSAISDVAVCSSAPWCPQPSICWVESLLPRMDVVRCSADEGDVGRWTTATSLMASRNCPGMAESSHWCGVRDHDKVRPLRCDDGD